MNAIAQTLAPVTAPASGFDIWMFVAIAVVVLAVVGFVYLKRKSPATAASLTATAGADLHAVGSGILIELGKLRQAVEDHLAKTPAAAPGPAQAGATEAPATVAPPAGKQSVAGVFSLPVTGDPKVDLPAITAAYLG